MPNFSSKNQSFWLFASIAMLVVCSSFTVVHAAGLRTQQRKKQRRRKLSKKGGNSNWNLDEEIYSNTYAYGASQTKPPSTGTNPFSVKGFDQKCPNQANTLDDCVVGSGGGGDVETYICRTCIVAVAGFDNPTMSNLNSCSDDNGHCNNCHVPAKNYYNCGTGSSLGDDVTTDPNNTGQQQQQQPPPTPAPIEENPVFVLPIGSYGPVSMCPPSAPQSGESCNTGNFDYLECPYYAHTCTCRKDSPHYMCV